MKATNQQGNNCYISKQTIVSAKEAHPDFEYAKRRCYFLKGHWTKEAIEKWFSAFSDKTELQLTSFCHYTKREQDKNAIYSESIYFDK